VGELLRRDGRWHRLVGRIAVQIGQAVGHNDDNDDDDDDDEDNNIEALTSSMFGANNATISLYKIDNSTSPFTINSACYNGP
jgi:hypothetical protein